jgi:hypothetical protein
MFEAENALASVVKSALRSFERNRRGADAVTTLAQVQNELAATQSELAGISATLYETTANLTAANPTSDKAGNRLCHGQRTTGNPYGTCRFRWKVNSETCR